MPKSFGPRAPRTKGDFLNRLLSIDFTGDLRDLFPHGVRIERDGPQAVMLIDKHDPLVRFQIVVRKPRTAGQLEAFRAKHAMPKARARRVSRQAAAQDGQRS